MIYMSPIPLAETFKNTVEVLNEVYDRQNGHEFLKFGFNLVKDGVIYIFKFGWLNDFLKFPIVVVQQSESVFSELWNYGMAYSPNIDFFVLSEKQIFTNPFLSGFLNCFWLYLPFSATHLIWLRRRIIDGPLTGRAATIGLVCGNLSLFGFCLFGARDFINVWYGFEPLSYFLGIILIFMVIFEMTHRPLRIIKKPKKKELLKIFGITFGLVWTDQPGLYQFLGNLSFHSGISPLDFDLSNSVIYFLGLILGSLFWAIVISSGIVRFGYIFPRLTNYKYSYSYWIRGFNNFCLIGCIALGLTSFPYYGFDYLLTNPLGFTSQDSIWEVTSFPKLKTETVDVKKGRLGEKSSYASVDTDLSLFDRGRYAGGPTVEFHIESLNYKEEYAWRSRFDRIASNTLTRSAGGNLGLFDQYLKTQLGPVEEALKKQRQEKQKKQRAQQIRQLKDLKKQRHSSKNEEFLSLTHDVDFFDAEFLEENEDLIERLIEDYTAEANFEDEQIPDLPNERMIDFSAFSEISKYGFDLFSMFEAVEVNPVDEELAKEIKQKYSDNLVYKFLVNCDISTLLMRQPKSHQLTSQDEIELFNKRLILGEYYDTLRSYGKLPNSFQLLFCGPKSYSNRIYNQQFKGTLKIVERLFSIHLEDDDNIPNVPSDTSNISDKNKEDDFDLYRKLKKEPSVLKFDQPLYKTDFSKKNPLLHEQLMEDHELSTKEVDSFPFLQESKSLPFFVGWDNQKRKLLVTNRLLTREKTLTSIKLEDLNNSQQKILNFTTWPVSEQALRDNRFFSKLYRTRDEIETSGDDLFKYAEPLMEEETMIYTKLPNIVEKVELKNPDKSKISLAPTRGGFIWAGNQPLKYKYKYKFLEQFKSWGFLQ
uniref:Hypothetical chloroplast RF1 n=1 Tax=Tydemania expeditionis TaxID=325645 RepID=A0A0D6E231_TYDEX|nr:hypothetical chloroplast RF1 [Tydemania expeditionis]CEO91098.1 hypothetical chloroplast RF1 [Tydemania expeditionis]